MFNRVKLSRTTSGPAGLKPEGQKLPSPVRFTGSSGRCLCGSQIPAEWVPTACEIILEDTSPLNFASSLRTSPSPGITSKNIPPAPKLVRTLPFFFCKDIFISFLPIFVPLNFLVLFMTRLYYFLLWRSCRLAEHRQGEREWGSCAETLAVALSDGTLRCM